ncbi:NAD(P)/FAD-dependent oxidoreductase [Roseibium salinum]|uniref:FAD-binding oxidoreductase n=1 Tax=Roseibium salinum TaxID=1604349 RepID=A0ABT3QZ88_9HYPH|nr:FAD-binding oxidoreductase [Roseibium sp. DSM 29163]MCX2722153.1 FAD-binding oxidoreductase [Roseibium sp. DSM 29163]
MNNRTKQIQSFDVMVLGAGIVGVSTAIHLLRMGLDVVLLDRAHPGAGASSGNAGIVQRNGFVPHAIPNRPQELLGILAKQSSAVSYDLRTVVRMLPWLRRHKAAGSSRGVETYSRVIAPLRAFAIGEHLELARSINADRFYRQGGWLHLYRNESAYRSGEVERFYARVFGVAYQELSAGELAKLEPGLKATGLTAVHWPESCSVSNPGAVLDALWRAYIREGGEYMRGDAGKLQRQRGGFALEGERGPVFAKNAVIALGAWSSEVLKGFGEPYPLAVKRGYHMHYRPLSSASLSRPVVDVANGFALTPTDNGIRLTTGVELAARDAPPNPNVIKLARRRAEEIFPLGRPLQDEPWMGSRPCLPDSLPVVGASPTIPRLWLNFGHADDGFTLGPITGRLLAEMIGGKAPFSTCRACRPCAS